MDGSSIPSLADLLGDLDKEEEDETKVAEVHTSEPLGAEGFYRKKLPRLKGVLTMGKVFV